MSRSRSRSNPPLTVTSELTLEESKVLREKALSDFWNTSLVKSPSTFGASPKISQTYKNDNGYAETNNCKKWTAHDDKLYTHGRVRVSTAFGKLAYNPGAGHYDPNYAAQSKTERIAPEITIAQRTRDNYFDELKQKEEDIKEKNKFMETYKNNTPKKRAPRAKIKKGKFADVNIEDMRKSLLPGPGSYDGNFSMIDRFPRPSSALMPKREVSVEPRPVVHAVTMTVLKKPSQLLPAGQIAALPPPSSRHF